MIRKFEQAQLNTNIDNIVLDSQFALSQIGRETPNELVITNQDIVRIGNLCEASFLRKLNISFNKLDSLEGIDQLPQLRELYGYSNSLENISQLASNNKFEVIYLQQNRVKSISNVFRNMNKLRDLRLDKNRLSKIEDLSSCQSLKSLNLSFNLLNSVDGLHGLLNLQELHLSNNNIKSLTSLKGLPALRELDISNNQLKSLDGIQYFPKLQILHAEHNHLVHVTFAVYGGKAAVSKAIETTQSMGSSSSAKSKNNMKSSSSTTSVNSTNKNNTNSTNTTGQTLPDKAYNSVLSELYLQHNRITTLTRLEQYGNSLEILDLSYNALDMNTILNITTQCLAQCSELEELRLHANPLYEEGEGGGGLEQLKALLIASCVQLRSCDDLILMHASHSQSQLSFPVVVPSSLDGGASVVSYESKEFHTWERDGSTVDLASVEEEQDEEGMALSTDDEEEAIARRKKIMKANEEQQDAAVATGVLEGARRIQPMLSEEQVQLMEGKFTSLLSEVKYQLSHLHRVFEEVQEDEEGSHHHQIQDEEETKTSATTTNSDAISLRLVNALEEILSLRRATNAGKLSTSESATAVMPTTTDTTTAAAASSEEKKSPSISPPSVLSSYTPQPQQLPQQLQQPSLTVQTNNTTRKQPPPQILLSSSAKTSSTTNRPLPSPLSTSSSSNTTTNTSSSSKTGILSLSSGTNRFGSKIHHAEVGYLQSKLTAAIATTASDSSSSNNKESVDFLNMKITSTSNRSSNNKVTFLKQLNQSNITTTTATTATTVSNDVMIVQKEEEKEEVVAESIPSTPSTQSSQPLLLSSSRSSNNIVGIGFDTRYHQSIIVTPLILPEDKNDDDDHDNDSQSHALLYIDTNKALQEEEQDEALSSARSENVLALGSTRSSSNNTSGPFSARASSSRVTAQFIRTNSAPLSRDPNTTHSHTKSIGGAPFPSPRQQLAIPHIITTLNTPTAKQTNALFKFRIPPSAKTVIEHGFSTSSSPAATHDTKKASSSPSEETVASISTSSSSALLALEKTLLSWQQQHYHSTTNENDLHNDVLAVRSIFANRDNDDNDNDNEDGPDDELDAMGFNNDQNTVYYQLSSDLKEGNNNNSSNNSSNVVVDDKVDAGFHLQIPIQKLS